MNKGCWSSGSFLHLPSEESSGWEVAVHVWHRTLVLKCTVAATVEDRTGRGPETSSLALNVADLDLTWQIRQERALRPYGPLPTKKQQRNKTP